MTDTPFNPDLVPDSSKPIFHDLQLRFPIYEVWIRRENYNRWLSAGVVNPRNGNTATIEIYKGGGTRRSALSQSEAEAVSRHLETDDVRPSDISIAV